MAWQFIISGFVLGLISSIHCIGMCGPIALSIPVSHLSSFNRNIALTVYNVGRVVTYTLLGCLLGVIGEGLSLAGFQRSFSIVLGVTVLSIVAFNYFNKRAFQPALINRFSRITQRWISMFLRSQKKSSYLLLGMANGLLPCGMVYIAIAGALSYQDVLSGSLFMLMYGLGTLPAMISFSLFGFYISLPVRNKIRKLTPLLMALMGIVLIIRGMNLNLPYLSPVIGNIFRQAVYCY